MAPSHPSAERRGGGGGRRSSAVRRDADHQRRRGSGRRSPPDGSAAAEWKPAAGGGRSSPSPSSLHGHGDNAALGSVSESALLSELREAESRLADGTVDLDEAARARSSGRDARGPTGRLTALAVRPFLDLLGAELDRASASLSSRLGGAEEAARALHAEAEWALEAGGGDGVSAERVRAGASGVEDAVRGVNVLARKSAATFRRIATEADLRLGHTDCRGTVEGRLERPPFSTACTGGVVIALLSDLYDMARKIEKQAAGNAKQWVAPDSFERKTHKYWADDERLAEWLMASVKALPILVYGVKGNIAPKRTSGAEWEIGTPINNVYFDSDRMSLYADRIIRAEGAQLLRVRWYGNKRPQGDEVLFMELKTHHEKWVNMKSVKQRVSICEKDMAAFLDTTARFTEDDARSMVVRAAPGLKEGKQNKAVTLLLECRTLTERHGLRPCVRTRYLRTAFQSSESNALRLTVDRSVTVIDERGAPPGRWCLPDGASVDVASQVIKIPCAVIEVKLGGEMDKPQFVYDLEGKGVISDGHKFSKYLTGGAVFNSDRVRVMPYWAEVPLFKPVFLRGEQHDSGPKANRGRTASGSKGAGRAGAGRSVSPPVPYASWVRSNTTTRPTPSLDTTAATTDFGSTFKTEAGEGDDLEKGGKQEHTVFSFGLLTGLRRRRGGDTEKHKVAQKRPTKVEPKSYFANERTFIQWTTAALLMVTISMIFFENGGRESAAMGMVLLALGMAMTLYALGMYYRRIQLMQYRSQYGYVDHVGPAVLTFAILMGVSAMLYFHFNHSGNGATAAGADPAGALSRRPAGKVLKSSPGECEQLDTTGMPPLEYQPSDAVVDETRKLLLVPSLGEITALPLYPSTSNQNVQVLAKIHGADFEALTYVGDVLYAVSEGSRHTDPELFVFEWTDDSMALSLVKSWKIPSEEVEGMAFVPSGRDDGKLYLASHIPGGKDGERARIDIYDVPYFGRHASPAASASVLNPVGWLNDDLMFRGLVDTTIGAMSYFENALHILHNNAMVMRSWDLSLGKMTGEVSLPAVSSGFHKQWEGVGFLRVSAGPGANPLSAEQVSAQKFRANRSTSASVLNVYLALDTPPEIWAIQFSGSTSDTWKPPRCFSP